MITFAAVQVLALLRKYIGENLGAKGPHAGSQLHISGISWTLDRNPCGEWSVREVWERVILEVRIAMIWKRFLAPVMDCAWITIASLTNHNSPRPHAFCSSCSMRRNRVSE